MRLIVGARNFVRRCNLKSSIQAGTRIGIGCPLLVIASSSSKSKFTLRAEEAITFQRGSPPEVTTQRSLHKLILDVIRWLQVISRALQVSLIFTPLIVTMPFSSLNKDRWYQLLVWTLEVSGPVFIKLGQWASTRRDLFNLRLCQQLSKLQRESKSHPWTETEKVLLKEFGPDYRSHFKTIDPNPIGSGCCAQVYKAKVNDEAGTDVAIKVMHPNIDSLFQRDLSVMKGFASLIYHVIPSLNYLSLKESIEEFSSLMKNQLDLKREADNLENFHQLFRDDESVIFPSPVKKFCRKNLIVETFEEGIHVADFLETEKFKQDLKLRKEISDIGIRMILKMIFIDNLVHGDLHPGNILIRYEDSSSKPKVVILDPGIVSSLSSKDLQYFREVFTAVVKKDGAEVGKLFLEHSMHHCENKEQFIQDMEKVVLKARSETLSLSKLDVAELLTQVFNTLMNHRVKLEAKYASVILAIMVLEGLGRTLDPDCDILAKAMPFLLKDAKKQLLFPSLS